MKSFEYEVAIVGGGSAGYAAARTVAAAGLKTVVIEGGEQIGGLCILRGCMPTKALLQCAEVLRQAEHAGVFGIRIGRVGFDFAEVMARKDRLIAEFAEYRTSQLQNGPFDFVRAKARFKDPHTIALDTGEIITAMSFVLSTGSKVAPNPLPGLEKVGCLTSDDALALRQLPKSLIVLGGGAVAIEFAQFFARFGVEVTLVQRSPHILHDMDNDVATVLETVLRREGLQVFTNTHFLEAWGAGGQKVVAFQHEGQVVRVSAEEILFALGRVPNSEGLNLEAIGVSLQDGRIVANPEMRTSVPHVYAAGDCTGPYEIVHLAVQQAEIAAHNIAFPSRPKRIEDRLLSMVIFSDPQVATVGLTEKAARARGIPHLVSTYLFSDHGKSLIMEARDGFVKLLADPVTGEILGAGVVGPIGGELIHEIIAGMSKGMTVHELAALPHYHPTLAEIWTYPAEDLAAKIPLPS